MTTLIHLVRHAESEHNINNDKHQHDPSLTERGFQQALQLHEDFPYHDRVAMVFTSPMRRTLQTALGGFGAILDKSSAKPGNYPGIENGARLIVYPDIQPRDDLPSETGSGRENLEKEFPGIDFSPLYPSWPKKDGLYENDNAHREETALRIKKHLAELSKNLEGEQRRDIVFVTHGFMKESITGRDRSDWPRASWKSYKLMANGKDDFTLQLFDS
jgi:broad specificity phosphatase PhoE